MQNEPGLVKRPLQLEDLRNISAVSAASLSADGRYLVHVTSRLVWDENNSKDYISVTSLDTMTEISCWEGSAPQWSPATNEIAYIAANAAETFLWIYALDEDSRRTVAPIGESHYFMGHVAAKGFAWSPDGSQIAYISADTACGSAVEPEEIRVIDRLLYKTKGGRGRPLIADNYLSHLWIVDVKLGKTRMLTTGDYNEHSLAWSPDGSRIAFISNRTEFPDDNQFYDLWSVGVVSGQITRHTEMMGTLYQPSWSPDGSHIAFLATVAKVGTNDSPAEDAQLYLVEIEDNTTRCLTGPFDRRIEQLCWSPNAEGLYFTAGNKGTTAIYKVEVDTGTVVPVAGEACHILEFSLDKTGERICFVSTDTTHLAEIYMLHLASNAFQQITHNSDSILQHCRLEKSETFWFNSFDGREIQGWIIQPAECLSGQKYPLVLVIHGGPHNMFGYEFEDRMQILAASGFGVLFINPRGSSGYGQAFSSGCVLNWGGGDYQDLMAGVDAAINRYSWIDEGRLGVTGQSYGGYMTNWIITQTNRFKAAVVDGGISNLVSFAGTSLYHSLIESEFNGSAYDNFPLLWQWSPLRNVKQVTTPTLILHGEVDNEVPVSQAEEMYIALKKLRVETRFVQYVGEGHGWRPDMNPHNRHDLLKRTLEWFNKYLSHGSDKN